MSPWQKIATDLERLLRLRAVPFGMKLFANIDEMEAIPRIRRPKSSVHTLARSSARRRAWAGRWASRRPTWWATNAAPS